MIIKIIVNELDTKESMLGKKMHASCPLVVYILVGKKKINETNNVILKMFLVLLR